MRKRKHSEEDSRNSTHTSMSTEELTEPKAAVVVVPIPTSEPQPGTESAQDQVNQEVLDSIFEELQVPEGKSALSPPGPVHVIEKTEPPAKGPAAFVGDLKFLSCVSGKTLGSDEGFIRKLIDGIPGLKEVSTVEECDVILAFCPVVSRAETDIESALKKLQQLSETKPAVLVVLHHTFDPEATVPDSSRSVDRGNTLTVDCLFHEDRGLLQCYSNQRALEKVTQWIKP
ncbi:uncharacterized protein [Salminus brasiliensis]|uniref:uncharacterized protein isoform X2 n=1 Tax=Salminus brasiliensis TaxID=930266 RepID=UPI003B83A2B8